MFRSPIRVLAIGECMVELTHRDSETLHLGCAGDTFNTALYLARVTDPDSVQVDYLTLVGDDRYSDRILAAMRQEGIGTGLVRRVPGARPGLYLVHTDPDGERTFTYYRSESPARRLFGPGHPEAASSLADGYDVVYLSAITLQILTPAARERVWDLLRQVRRRGGTVAFDSNYRPAGWPEPGSARAAVQTAWQLASIALPTFDDECALFADDTPADSAVRLAALGIPDVVVKDGARGCVVWDGSSPRRVAAQKVQAAVDTTAAGDAFNAAYLAARLTGKEPVEAAGSANALAAEVVRHRGAAVPASVLPRRAETSLR
ncbi:MAG: sugar kinase [Streptomyces sp.]|uniref:sugar kinase n=1 Tax=Streptomyces sp. TaxID=1931 RepID=UPI003D6C3EB7